MNQETSNQANLVNDDDFYADVFRVFKECEMQTMPTSEWFQKNFPTLINNARSRSNFLPIRILSVGCGNGLIDSEILGHLLEYSHLPIEYVGVDTNLVHLQQAQQNINAEVSSTFIHSTVEEFLTVNKEQFDLVIAIHCLYYIPERKYVLEQLVKTCLKHDGKLVIQHQSSSGINAFQRLTNNLLSSSLMSTTNVQVNSLEIEDILMELNLSYKVHVENVVVNVTNCCGDIESMPIEGYKLLSFFLERDVRNESKQTLLQIVNILKSICTFRRCDNRYLLFHPDVYLTISPSK